VPPCDARRRSGAPDYEPAIHGWSYSNRVATSSRVARTQHSRQSSRQPRATSHGWRVRPLGPPKVRRASQGVQGSCRRSRSRAWMPASPRRRRMRRQARTPGRPRSAGNPAPRMGAGRTAGGVLEVQEALHKQGLLLGPRQRTETAVSLATRRQPRTQDSNHENEAPQSRARLAPTNNTQQSRARRAPTGMNTRRRQEAGMAAAVVRNRCVACDPKTTSRARQQHQKRSAAVASGARSHR
jgi:hypothetical protein